MEPTPLVPVPETLVEILRSAQSITVLTGAGISAESGIPTFRDSQVGLWAKYEPQELATPEAFEKNPKLVMDWYRWRYELVGRSQPNPGHLALAELEKRVPHFTLITQNVDGLHALAGSKTIVELHGSLRRLRCHRNRSGEADDCGYFSTEWPGDRVPRCPRCGSLLRPDVVWFGETLPESALKDALSASRLCDVFFSVGTSGVVEPAASLPYEARRSGAVIIEVNPQPTPLSVYTQYEFPHPAGIALPQILQAAWPEG